MTRQLVQMLLTTATVVGFTSVAHAAAWGTLEDAYKCEKEVDAVGQGSTDEWLTAARKSGQGLSAVCLAEIEKRVPTCEQDPWTQRVMKDPDLKLGDPKSYCFVKSFASVWEQVVNDRRAKKDAEEQAKVKEEEKAKEVAQRAAVEVPQPKMHDASLEKAVADAYHRYDPPAKVIKVVLGRWADDLEKDAFGRVTGRDLDATVVNRQPNGKCVLHNEYYMQHGNGRSFSGPLKARGAGSASDKEILCEKIAAGASKSSARKKP